MKIQFEILGFSQGQLFIDCGGKGCSDEFVKKYYSFGGKGQISPGWKHIVYYDHNLKPTVPYERLIIKRK